MNFVGYARKSHSRETIESQIDTLLDYGLKIDSIFKERRSSLDEDRPVLSDCINSLNSSDKLVVTRLSQIANSISHLVQIKNTLEQKDVSLIIISQGLNSSSKNLDFYSMITLFSEFEMDLRLERQLIGVQKAKENGVKFGRKPIDNKVIQTVKRLFLEGTSVGQISLKLALGKSTVYRLLK
jgi:DNA invertase Pin-like site-specific DNA recombinase